MSNKKPMTEKKQRRTYESRLRQIATRVVTLVAVIEKTERDLSIPGTPYREVLGAIEEYYNSLADEFVDIPGEGSLQSFEAAMRTVREMHLASCRDPLAPLIGYTERGKAILLGGAKEVQHAKG